MTTQTITAPSRLSGPFLSMVLRLDAAASGALGVLLLAAGWAVDDLLGLPVALTAPIGGFLVVWAGVIAALGIRRTFAAGAIRAVVAVNAAWVVASLALAVTGDLTGLGIAFVIAQAAAVALFAELQITGLRKARQEP